MQRVWLIAAIVAAAAVVAPGQELPEGPGRVEAEKLCKQCHEMARSISKRQDRDAWIATLTRMSAFGMKSTDAEFGAVVEYLTKNYPADDIPKVNVNTATAIQLESGLTMRRSLAAAVIAYRSKNGKFKSIDDLKKIPGIGAAKLDEKKDRITF